MNAYKLRLQASRIERIVLDVHAGETIDHALADCARVAFETGAEVSFVFNGQKFTAPEAQACQRHVRVVAERIGFDPGERVVEVSGEA